MADITTLKVQLTANATKFQTAFKKAEARVNKFNKKTDEIKKKVAAFAQAAGTVAGPVVAGLTAITAAATAAAAAYVVALNKIRKELNEVAKFSTRIGVGVEELTKLQFAADKASVPVTTLRMGMQRMTRRVSEAAMGTGEAVAALKELGLSADALASSSPDEQLLKIFDAARKLGGQDDRVGVVMKIVDTEGVALAQMAAQGAEARDKERKRAEELGVAMSERAAAGAEVLTDNLTDLGSAIQGVFNKSFESNMNLMAGLFQKMTSFAVGFGKVVEGGGLGKFFDKIESFTLLSSMFTPGSGGTALGLFGASKAARSEAQSISTQGAMDISRQALKRNAALATAQADQVAKRQKALADEVHRITQANIEDRDEALERLREIERKERLAAAKKIAEEEKKRAKEVAELRKKQDEERAEILAKRAEEVALLLLDHANQAERVEDTRRRMDKDAAQRRADFINSTIGGTARELGAGTFQGNRGGISTPARDPNLKVNEGQLEQLEQQTEELRKIELQLQGRGVVVN